MQFIERTCTILMFTPDAPSVSFTTVNGQKNEHDFLLHFHWSLPKYHLYSSSTQDCHVKLGQSVVFSLRQKAVFDSHHSGDMLVLCKSNLRGTRFPAITNYFQTQSGQPPSCESVPKTSPFLQKLSVLFWFTVSCLFTGRTGSHVRQTIMRRSHKYEKDTCLCGWFTNHRILFLLPSGVSVDA